MHLKPGPMGGRVGGGSGSPWAKHRAPVLVLGGVLAVAALVVATVAGAAVAVGLGRADPFAVLAGAGVTNTGPSVVNGDLGTCPTIAVAGFPPGVVNGTVHAGDAVCTGAQTDLTTAYNNAALQPPTTNYAGPTDLGGLTLTPGVYRTPTSFAITGTLTLDGQGDPNAVFIFQAGSTLITATSSRVVLINGAQACNVFWQVGSSATLGVGSTFVGTILALTSITANTNATVQGRLLARNGAVTLDSNTITRPMCAGAGATTTTVGAGATTTTVGAGATTTTLSPTATTLAPTATTAAPTATTIPPAGVPIPPALVVTPPSALPTQPVTITGTGFLPNELVVLGIDNVPLGVVVASPTGTFSQVVTLPANIAPGAHPILALGLTSGRTATGTVNVPGAAGALLAVPSGLPGGAVAVPAQGVASAPAQAVAPQQQQQQQQAGAARSAAVPSGLPAASAASASAATARGGALPFTGSSSRRAALIGLVVALYGLILLSVKRSAGHRLGRR